MAQTITGVLVVASSGSGGGSAPPASLSVSFYGGATAITAGEALAFTLYYTLEGQGSVSTTIAGTVSIGGQQVGSLVPQSFAGTATESGYLNISLAGGTVPQAWAGQELTIDLFVGGQLVDTTTLQVANPVAPASFNVSFQSGASEIPAGAAASVDVDVTNVGGVAGNFTRVTGRSVATDGTVTDWATDPYDAETIAAGSTTGFPLNSQGAVAFSAGTASLTVTSQTGQTTSETLIIA